MIYYLLNRDRMSRHGRTRKGGSMSEIPDVKRSGGVFRGPNIGIIATVFVVLFCGSLYPVTAFGGMPYFPEPTATLESMVAFFDRRSAAVLACAFLQFGAAIVLGLFTVSVVSQLKYLGVKAAGTGIALFGGLLSAFNIMAGTIFLWTMTYPGIAQERQLLHALYRLTFAFGGIGFSVPCGLLFAGVSVTSGIYKLLPKWIVILGLIVAVIGELSWFEMLTPRVLMLIPLTRFPGFVWLIAAGFALPKTRKRGVTA
jgi:hypothetical protein